MAHFIEAYICSRMPGNDYLKAEIASGDDIRTCFCPYKSGHDQNYLFQVASTPVIRDDQIKFQVTIQNEKLNVFLEVKNDKVEFVDCNTASKKDQDKMIFEKLPGKFSWGCFVISPDKVLKNENGKIQIEEADEPDTAGYQNEPSVQFRFWAPNNQPGAEICDADQSGDDDQVEVDGQHVKDIIKQCLGVVDETFFEKIGENDVFIIFKQKESL